MKPVFSPDDFADILLSCSEGQRRDIADIANARIESLLGPEVRGYKNKDSLFEMIEFSKLWPVYQGHETHTARLFDVRPIENVECEHKPESYNHTVLTCYPPIYKCDWKCSKCGVKLKQSWEVSE